MKTKIALLVCLLALTSLVAQAKPNYAAKERGWHKGAYLLFGGGSLNVDKDTNVLTNRAFGSKNILGFGMTTGWNFIDWLAVELQLRYGTEKVAAQREHTANINLNLKYSIITDALTSAENIRFLPYIKAGGGAFGAAVPDTSAGNDRFGVYGPLADVGGGLEILIVKKLYVGVDFTYDFVWLQNKNNSAGQRILNGGFDPQYSVFGYLGVHF